MLKRIPAPIKGVLSVIVLTLHTILWCLPMYVLLILKFLSPTRSIRACADKLLVKTANGWIGTNNLWLDLTQNTVWNIPNLEHLKLDDWYFITCNHQSWIDILVLQRMFLGKVPFIRFFIKRELLFLPFLGLAWWAYDFPIMSRHSKQQIEKNPSLKGKDLITTKKACEKYQDYPVTILNFLEGTRFTPQKHQSQQSPYQHLLTPKLGGFSYAIYAMDKKIRHLLDVTIVYPHGNPNFWDFLCGRVKEVKVYVQSLDIPENLLHWESLEDTHKRNQFKDWITQLWQEKDSVISSTKPAIKN